MPLHNLPQELLRHICSYLQPTVYLHSFSLADKRCRAAAASIQFQHITINASRSKEDLEKDFTSLAQTLESVGLNNVFLLEMKDFETFKRAERRLDRYDGPELHDDNRILGINESRVDIWDEKGMGWDESTWLPIVQLIERLPALAEIIWSCPARLPDCIFDAMRRSHPSCKLSLPMFTFGKDPRAALRYAQRIAPFLCDVRVYSHPSSHESGISQAMAAFMHTVLGRAPELRELKIVFPGGWRSALDGNIEKSRELMSLAEESRPSESRVVRPGWLDLDAYAFTDKNYLSAWSRVVDFAAVHTLLLRKELSLSAMVWLALHQPFKNLHTLRLHLLRGYPTHRNHALIDFLTSLRPLRVLHMEGQYSEASVLELIDTHGPSLSRLCMIPQGDEPTLFDLDSITTLRRKCPNLENLQITISRSKGDAIETAIYRILGEIPKLENLRICLDCSNRSLCTPEGERPLVPIDPSFDDFHQQLYPPGASGAYELDNRPVYGHIRENLINSALDDKLARSIYSTIMSARPTGSPPLQLLEVRTTGGDYFADYCSLPGLPECFTKLEQSYRVVRSVRDDMPGVLEVTHLNRRETDPWKPEYKLQRALRHIFQRLWPERPESNGDWRKDWHSFPLHGDEEE